MAVIWKQNETCSASAQSVNKAALWHVADRRSSLRTHCSSWPIYSLVTDWARNIIVLTVSLYHWGGPYNMSPSLCVRVGGRRLGLVRIRIRDTSRRWHVEKPPGDIEVRDRYIERLGIYRNGDIRVRNRKINMALKRRGGGGGEGEGGSRRRDLVQAKLIELLTKCRTHWEGGGGGGTGRRSRLI